LVNLFEENTLFTNVMEGYYMLKLFLTAPLRRMGAVKEQFHVTLTHALDEV
jgi:hypothetical protein